MVAKDNLKKLFSDRLNGACEDRQVRQRGRAVDIQKALKGLKIVASTTIIGQWLSGEKIPSREKIVALAGWLGVRAEWLEYGVGDKTAADVVVEDRPALTPAQQLLLDATEGFTTKQLQKLIKVAGWIEEGREIKAVDPPESKTRDGDPVTAVGQIS